MNWTALSDKLLNVVYRISKEIGHQKFKDNHPIFCISMLKLPSWRKDDFAWRYMVWLKHRQKRPIAEKIDVLTLKTRSLNMLAPHFSGRSKLSDIFEKSSINSILCFIHANALQMCQRKREVFLDCTTGAKANGTFFSAQLKLRDRS